MFSGSSILLPDYSMTNFSFIFEKIIINYFGKIIVSLLHKQKKFFFFTELTIKANTLTKRKLFGKYLSNKQK